MSQNYFDRAVTYMANVVRLVVIVPSWRPRFVEHTLHFQVRPRLNEIGNRLPKTPQGLQESFPFVERAAITDDRSKCRIPVRTGEHYAHGGQFVRRHTRKFIEELENFLSQRMENDPA